MDAAVPRLVIGSKNPKKRREIVPLLEGTPWEVLDLSAYPDAPTADETGKTFAENARIKAVFYAKFCGATVLAEDSGLVVPAINGEPGVDSALYAGSHGDDRANNAKLLERMTGLAGEKRAAYYVCYAVVARPDGSIVGECEGRCHGRVVEAPRGPGDFGYDPLFEVPEYHKTFGELSGIVKQALSHRAKAVGGVLRQLRSAG